MLIAALVISPISPISPISLGMSTTALILRIK